MKHIIQYINESLIKHHARDNKSYDYILVKGWYPYIDPGQTLHNELEKNYSNKKFRIRNEISLWDYYVLPADKTDYLIENFPRNVDIFKITDMKLINNLLKTKIHYKDESFSFKDFEKQFKKIYIWKEDN